MRIALITREYPPETAWGGIGRFYGVFARALRDSGHQVEVFTQGIGCGGMEIKEGITIHKVMPRKWVIGKRAGGDLAGMGANHLGIFAFSLAVGMFTCVRARHRQQAFDLVEGHEHLGINSLINLRYRHEFATVSRYHTTYHSLVSRKLVNWPASSVIRKLESVSISLARARISASTYVDSITRKDFPGSPAAEAIIPLFPEAQDRAGALPAFCEREKLIIFVGRLMPGHKNPELAAEAFCRLAGRFAEWRLEFAGLDIELAPGDTAWQRCQRILRNLNGRYRYHGVLNAEELQKLYRRARICLVPSGFESFGLVALESMAAGCVPVVADATALPEVVANGGIVFRNGSLDDLVERTAALMADAERQERLSEFGVRRAAEEFSNERILRRNVEFFEQLCHSSLSRHA